MIRQISIRTRNHLQQYRSLDRPSTAKTSLPTATATATSSLQKGMQEFVAPVASECLAKTAVVGNVVGRGVLHTTLAATSVCVMLLGFAYVRDVHEDESGGGGATVEVGRETLAFGTRPPSFLNRISRINDSKWPQTTVPASTSNEQEQDPFVPTNWSAHKNSLDFR
mmetsp:Transcript_20970/g.52974  ORF Transcript_20970/g.52974 Transcript_20970/m.52974 type:complete len:167 (+) Transcript_20970:78-578(+)